MLINSVSEIITHMEYISRVDLSHLDVSKILEKEPKNIERFVDLLWELFIAKKKAEPLDNIMDDNSSTTEQTSDIINDTSLLENLGDFSGLDSEFNHNAIGKPKTKVLGDKHLQVWLNTVQDDVERFANRHATKITKKEKKLRFEKDTVNDPLEITVDDNPHIAALKLKYISLLKNKPKKNSVCTKLVDILKRHEKVTKIDPPKLAIRKEEPVHRPISASPTIEKDFSNDSLDQELGYEPDFQGKAPDNLPEKNLEEFFQQIKSHIPILRRVTDRDYEMATKAQISLTRKALDNRLWQHKVDLQKELESIKDTAPLDFLLKQIDQEYKAKQKRQEILSLKNAKSALDNQYRRVKRLQYRQKSIVDSNKRLQRAQELKEEQLTNGLVNRYMEQQRKTIIEYRKEENELKRQLMERRQQETDKKTFILEQQIEMVKEEIEKLRHEEELIKKSEREVIITYPGNIAAHKGNQKTGA
ncbi:hypothetical protein HK103_001707 [Boothiomyces macroporosus]|uniref:DUF5745 domain-containing protein n=1 Tax=Boothiomyces macroporosus TaxID=261099 RepID=A0AAD5Y718_9FUNG|nr:hypothetical protein HK103_001707 [Boothiomyces macroporosus]